MIVSQHQCTQLLVRSCINLLSWMFFNINVHLSLAADGIGKLYYVAGAMIGVTSGTLSACSNLASTIVKAQYQALTKFKELVRPQSSVYFTICCGRGRLRMFSTALFYASSLHSCTKSCTHTRGDLASKSSDCWPLQPSPNDPSQR